MKDAAFLDELWRVADSIIAHFNAGEAIKILTDKLAMHGDGVLFHLPVGRKTAWGTDLMFWNHGRFYSLTINHAEWFEKYKRELEYHADYWFTERFLNEKFRVDGVTGEIANPAHAMQNYCYWTISGGKVGIQQSDRDGSGSLLTEMIFIPAEWTNELKIPVFIYPESNH
jgi:hypothetical protein